MAITAPARSNMHRPGNLRVRLAAVLAVGLVAAACGGGGSKNKAVSSTTSTSVQESTTSTSASVTGDTTASTSTSTTAASAATATTAKKATSTATKKTTATTVTPSVNKQVTGGIGNVVSTSSTAPSKEIQPGGTLTIGEGPDVATGFDMNQVITGNKTPQYMAVLDVLVYTDPQDGQVKGQIADSLTSTDAVVWTLKIKPNVRFTDGTLYDAAAIKFNWARLQDPANASQVATYANLMQSMDPVDATTLKITLKKKNAVFPQALTQIPFIGSPTAMQSLGTGFAANPVGAGPFKLKEWVRDDHLTLVRNPNYWNAPRPYVDQIIIRTIIDETQRINTFNSGALNEMYVASVPNAAGLSGNANAVPNPSVLNGGIIIDFNTTKAPFNDIRARQAIAYAIDPKDYVKVVDGGAIDSLDSPFRHDSPFYDANILQLPYNPTKAQQLFDAVAADNGGTLSFSLSTFNVQNYMTAALYVQGILGGYKNVKVTLVSEQGSGHIANINNRNYQAGITGSVFIDPEPQWTSVYGCNASPSPTGWCSTKFDAAVTDNQLTLDPATRIKDVKDAESEFFTQVPALFIERRYSWTFTAPQVQDFQMVNDNNQLVDRTWIKSH
jgi:peptide/nickel transport system substrate-binding protein